MKNRLHSTLASSAALLLFVLVPADADNRAAADDAIPIAREAPAPALERNLPEEQAVRMDLPSAQHARAADSLGRLGFRPISLDVYGDPAKPLHASSWIRRRGPPWFLIHGVSEAAIRDSLAAWSRRGWHAILISGTGEAPAYAAVLAKDTMPSWTLVALDREGFRRVCDSAQRSGYRPAWLDAHGTAERPLFSGVWRRNTDRIPWNYSMGDDAASLQEKAATFAPVWVRPSLVAPMPGGRMLTLWEEGSVGPWSLHPALSAEGALEALKSEAARGLHPLCISGADNGAGRTLVVLAAGRADPLPKAFTATGPESQALAGFDEYMRRLMQVNQVRSGALAMVKDGRLVFARGYTWAEDGYPVTQPTSLFRVASCSKPLTSMAIHKMLREAGQAEGPLSLKEKVLALLNPQAGNVPTDTRFGDITVDDLLSHSAGWIRSKENPDPVFNDYPAGHAIRRRLPAYGKDFLAYMLGQPLQFAPGSQSSYANFGYFLLGRILETLPHGLGRSYEQAMADLVFRPLGLSRPRFGGSLIQDRLPGEVLYHARHPYLQRGRDPQGPAWVPGAYGDFDLRNMDAAGAWILAATDYAKVLASFDLEDANPVLPPEAVRTMWAGPHDPRFLRGWFATRIKNRAGGKDTTLMAKWHNGLFPGTSSLVFYRPDKWSFALFLNRDIDPQLTGDVHGRQLGRIADRVENWPQKDLFPEMGIRSFAFGGNPEAKGPEAGAGHYITSHP